MLPVAEEDKRTTLHLTCEHCGGKTLVAVSMTQFGMMSFGIMTDLEFGKVFRAAGESTIFSLSAGKGAALNVLVHDVQTNPLTSRVSHVDFYQVRMDEELETNVPLELINESPAVREGGILVKTLEEVTFDDQIKVSDLKPGKGVEILTEADTVLALVEAPRTAADIAALDTKIEMDVTKVEGVVKETPAAEAEKK